MTDVLAGYVAVTADPRVTAVERRLRLPVSVAVRGRRGVGRDTVAAALAAAGVAVAAPGATADIDVVVLSERLTEEEQTVLLCRSVPTLVVLNKADLGAASAGGPLAAADATAARLSVAVGLPVVPMVALLASAEVHDDDLAALRALVDAPADMTSVDAFAAGEHLVPAEVRRALLDRLDRFGLAHAVLAAADGLTPATVTARLRALSRIDAVLAALAGVAAPVRYARIRAAVHALRVLAAETSDERLAAFLDGDDVVLAVMTAAVDVVEATGAEVDRGDDAGAHTRRALRWHGFARAPLDALHRRCAADIARGSLRLLEACGE
ncbi:hypothetical protein [Mycolicibacterium psychrotolerans]|uniref:GTPase n=1 Tax=Mycolicibacterium psychrotolerans TaxID=216929 RepID=A0A7I7M757_9MYCO|nr:hypothetical protein [Mycolicibacterium psychrotolerans]BBX67209.1 hypothetical protein MPSYJ_06700 [Mycolicibacterium psychrotolerans]